MENAESVEVKQRDRDRFVSKNGECSCQYRASWGIACRHMLCVSTVTQYREKGVMAVLGGAVDKYWLPGLHSPQTPVDLIDASESLCVSDNEDFSSILLHAASGMNKEQRNREVNIMLGPLIDDTTRSQAVFNAFRDTFNDYVQRIGSSIGTEIRNPSKQTNKPGRKRRDRFPNQHDFIHGIKKSCKR